MAREKRFITADERNRAKRNARQGTIKRPPRDPFTLAARVLKVAGRFNARMRIDKRIGVAARRLKPNAANRHSHHVNRRAATGGIWGRPRPWVETHGYHQTVAPRQSTLAGRVEAHGCHQMAAPRPFPLVERVETHGYHQTVAPRPSPLAARVLKVAGRFNARMRIDKRIGVAARRLNLHGTNGLSSLGLRSHPPLYSCPLASIRGFEFLPF